MKSMIKILTVAAAFLLSSNVATADEAIGGAYIPDNGSALPVPVGFRWDRCRFVHHSVGSSRTYCWLHSNGFYVWTDDDRAENILIACAASSHSCGFNFTTTSGNWNFVRLWGF